MRIPAIISRQILTREHFDNTHQIHTMAGFDDAGVFFSDNFGSEDQPDDGNANRLQIKKRFKEFIRQFHEGNFSYRYR